MAIGGVDSRPTSFEYDHGHQQVNGEDSRQTKGVNQYLQEHENSDKVIRFEDKSCVSDSLELKNKILDGVTREI